MKRYCIFVDLYIWVIPMYELDSCWLRTRVTYQLFHKREQCIVTVTKNVLQ